MDNQKIDEVRKQIIEDIASHINVCDITRCITQRLNDLKGPECTEECAKNNACKGKNTPCKFGLVHKNIRY